MTDWELWDEETFFIQKILELDVLKKKRFLLKGKNVVFVNGFFDLFHVGHLMFLYKARCWGDVLIVGVNSNSSVEKEDVFAKNSKKRGRIINDEIDRAVVISSLFFVDYVTIFEEANPEKVIMELEPDVLVKGKDWEGKEIVGADYVRGNGGEVIFEDSECPVTTTEIIEKIKKL